MRVLGRKKCTFVRIFVDLRDTEPLTALATFPAFLAPPFLASASAAACFFGPMTAPGFACVGAASGRYEGEYLKGMKH